MRILLTNDDGILAEGINSLYNILSENHKVYIIAPDTERSACSNALSIRSEIKVQKISDSKYAISGFPADCVNIGLNSNLIPEVDLIISGINHGFNLGDDIFFSGTVAGARSAYIFGKPGIAVSIDSHHKPSKYFDDASIFINNFLENILDEFIDKLYLFNINYPNLPKDKIKGVKYTKVGKRIYNDSYNRNVISNNEMIMKLSGFNGEIKSLDIENSDATELKNGYISITPLQLDCTNLSYYKLKTGKNSD